MKSKFSVIAIIYNPKSSSGESHERAANLQLKLNRRGLSSNLYATEHAGHGAEIAANLAEKYVRPLLVSVSGDGGYHDVINGAILGAAKSSKKRTPVCAVLSAGNANDHRSATKKRPLATSIAGNKTEPLGLLKISIRIGRKTEVVYGHSYFGIGLTARGARTVQAKRLGKFEEVRKVVADVMKTKPARLSINDGPVGSYDSVVTSAIDRMAKVVRFAGHTPDPNVFNLAVHPHRRRALLPLRMLSFLATRGQSAEQTELFSCITHSAVDVQIDGEAHTLPKGTQITVRSEPGVIETCF